MYRLLIIAVLSASPALAGEELQCYRMGFVCDCHTGVCEGNNPRNTCPVEWITYEHGKAICDVPGGVALIAQPGAPRQDPAKGD